MRPARSHVLAERLRAAILSGEYRAGARLPAETALAAAHGLSRATVRGALAQLAGEGLINTRRGVTGGAFVTPADPAATAQAIAPRLARLGGAGDAGDARLGIGLGIVALAAGRRTPAQLADIHRAVVVLATLDRPDDRLPGDLAALLRALADAAAAPVLDSLMAALGPPVPPGDRPVLAQAAIALARGIEQRDAAAAILPALALFGCGAPQSPARHQAP
jgi:DNA-binding FadR family transcriptional regulator